MSVDVPPRYVVAPARLVYADLPRSIVLTGIRIWGLGWRHNYEYTGPVTEEDLLELLGLRRAALFEHLKCLVSTGVLRYTTIDTRLKFDFTASRVTSRAPPGRTRGSPENWTRADMSVVDVEVNPCVDSEQQQQQDGRAREVLVGLSVLEPTRSEILRLGWVTADYLRAWRAWYDEQAGLGVGFLVEQWRAGAVAPERAAQREKRMRQESYARYNIQT